MSDVIIIGGGAAGLWAAEVAARNGAGVVVLEKTDRTGTKVLASGGSRCNLTTSLEALEAGRHFRARGARFLGPALSAVSPKEVRRRFDSWGVPSVEAPLEKVFPASDRAKDVRDALESAATRAGAQIRLNSPVQAVQEEGGGWRITLLDGSEQEADRVILAAGGCSYPMSGTTGDGYGWLTSLGLPIIPPTPALVPLLSPASWVHELAGISVQDAEVRLHDGDGRLLARRSRPILFTHRGVSGPGAMDLSVYVARASSPLDLRIDLLPGLDRDTLRLRLIDAAGAPGDLGLYRTMREVPRRLLSVVAEQACIDDSSPVKAIDRSGRHRLIEALKGLSIPVEGTEGFSKAEVTAGGLDLRAVNPRTMGVNGCPGLYVVGELLDLDGPIGGFSFLAAFATAELAGSAAAAED